MTWYNKLLIGAIAGAIFWTGGLLYERANLTAYKGEVKGMAESQGKIVKAIDAKNQGDANVSQTQYLADLQSVHAYYAANPVTRVQYRNGGCAVSSAVTGASGVDAASTSGYVSPYSPADTEAVAVKLDALQKLLISDGVTVK
jgi:hypothetical protein